MKTHSFVLVTTSLVFTILTTSATAQLDYCRFPKPMRVIKPSALPAPILNTLGLGQYSKGTTNNTESLPFFAGRLNDFYFSWSEEGNGIKIVLIRIFHMTQKNTVDVLEGGWFGFGGFSEMCKTTKGLLDKFTVPSQKSSMVKSQDAIASPPPLIPYPPISQRLGEQGTTELAVNMG